MILGLRCSSKDYAFAILDGQKSKPTVVAHGFVSFPKGFSAVQRAAWFLQELNGILDGHNCDAIVLKAFEGRARDNSFVERVEHESMAYLAASRKGIKSVVRKVKSTTAKDLGFKGRGKYLASADTSHFPNFASYDQKVQEALLVGWSSLT